MVIAVILNTFIKNNDYEFIKLFHYFKFKKHRYSFTFIKNRSRGLDVNTRNSKTDATFWQ